MRIGIIACDILKLELERILAEMGWTPEVIFLDAALHVRPKAMRETLVEEINRMADRVDAVFLGYGICQSLEGIEADCDIPVMLPTADDCIALMMGSDTYAQEVKKEVGTWFMTPGWAKVGIDMVIRELRLERVVKYGKDPREMARRIFTHYRRGLLVDTGVGDEKEVLADAENFCREFSLTLERTQGDCALLRKWVERAKDWTPEHRTPSPSPSAQ